MSSRVKTTYALVRRDIPLANQLAQLAHACQEAGSLYQPPVPAGRLIVLEVPTERSLQSAVIKIEAHGIKIHPFYEPDYPLGYSAACTEPVGIECDDFFMQFKLWGLSTS